MTGWSEDQFVRVAEEPDVVAAEQLRGAEGMRKSLAPFVELGVDGAAIGQD
jgi:hypothetical protein